MDGDDQGLDARLMDRFRQGDEEAFRVLLERHQGHLEARIRRCLPRPLHRKMAVSDVLQESCVVAFERREDFENRGPLAFRNWLLGIVERKARDAVRRYERTAKRSSRREVTQAERQATGAFPGRWPTPSQIAIGAESEQVALSAIRSLPLDYQEVLRLTREEGLTLKQTAERMGRSHAAIRKLLGRALCRFREEFERRGGHVDA